MDTSALLAAGFVPDDTAKANTEAAAERAGMHASGPYAVHAVLRRGGVLVALEQNTSEDGDVLVTYPAVCVVSGPKGTVACSAKDTDLILQLATDVE